MSCRAAKPTRRASLHFLAPRASTLNHHRARQCIRTQPNGRRKHGHKTIRQTSHIPDRAIAPKNGDMLDVRLRPPCSTANPMQYRQNVECRWEHLDNIGKLFCLRRVERAWDVQFDQQRIDPRILVGFRSQRIFAAGWRRGRLACGP
jgi:hypothetical protein